MAETMDWERLRSRARYLESELERSLPDLTRIARDTHSTGAEEARLSTAIEAALKELADVAERMGAEVERAPSAARSAVLEKYADVLSTFRGEYAGTARELKATRDRRALFCGADASDPEGGGGASHLAPVAKERQHVANAARGVGDVIEAAHEARSDLASQRATLEASHTGVGGIAASLPTIEGVIEAMRAKKTRHNAIIGVTIGLCSSFLIWAVIA